MLGLIPGSPPEGLQLTGLLAAGLELHSIACLGGPLAYADETPALAPGATPVLGQAIGSAFDDIPREVDMVPPVHVSVLGIHMLLPANASVVDAGETMSLVPFAFRPRCLLHLRLLFQEGQASRCALVIYEPH